MRRLALMTLALALCAGCSASERELEQARTSRSVLAEWALLAELRGIGVPIGTMSTAIVDGLRAFGAKEIGVATAYGDDINEPLRDYMVHSAGPDFALEGFGGAKRLVGDEGTDED